MKHIEKIIGIILLLIGVGFNLWTYRLEPTALGDPNDNTFQFALVDRTNQIWSFAQQKCTGISQPFCMISLLSDHWVPNWAEGYNLPYYYSHVPQIIIVATWRLFSLFSSQYSLFTHYHWVIYFLLSLFPVSVFIALQTIGIPAVAAGIGAIIASHLSTDGLYGLDPASFLWRGYGLSSQLFAMVWLPLALAYAWHYFSSDTHKRSLVPTIFFLAATTSGHLGIGIIAFISVGIIAMSPFLQSILKQSWDGQTKKNLVGAIGKLLLIFGGAGILLAYWIVPILLHGNYHNISVWDGIWKFNSFGYREILSNLFNGDLFDFGRLPVLTGLTLLGFFLAVGGAYFEFALLFAFWLLMYFGRVTWGGLFSLIPGMNEYHLSRFIVGVHLAGLFLIPIGIKWNFSKIHSTFILVLYVLLAIFVLFGIAPQTIRYANHNDFLIKRGNTDYQKDSEDIDKLITTLRTKIQQQPGRVFAGRGGSWGKDFRIAETPLFMHLSTYGIPVILWLPETWSPNSDTEQYFSENNPAHYSLYNVRYVVTPVNLAPDQIQPFWKLIETGKTWKLYEVVTDGYITAGVKPAMVSSTKMDYRSVVRLWMHSNAYTQGLFPGLTFDTDYPKGAGLPNFRMLDEVTYKVPDGSIHNLFSEVPRYQLPTTHYPLPTIISQSADSDMIFKARVEVKNDCIECIVILKQSFHPSWRATVDGKPTDTFAVFPFYTAVKLESAGKHEVIFSYQPSPIKKLLLIISLLTLGGLFWLACLRRQARPNSLPTFKA